ncbi:MAG: MFS transporter, partial [Schwartzia sp.]|nr:MFS transporter [Schwartzia sp. (in: firmicutes)]
MPVWKKNLWLCCLSCFIVSIGMSQLAPMLPLYLAEMGMKGEAEIARWSGLIFGINFVTLAVSAPIWGRLSDRFGRKPMVLRASGWLAVIMLGFGFAETPEHLFILRLIQGALSGFLGAAVPLVAQETPKERSGWALGLFFTSQVSGALVGPLIGGWLIEEWSCRQAFIIVSAWCFLG